MMKFGAKPSLGFLPKDFVWKTIKGVVLVFMRFFILAYVLMKTHYGSDMSIRLSHFPLVRLFPHIRPLQSPDLFERNLAL